MSSRGNHRHKENIMTSTPEQTETPSAGRKLAAKPARKATPGARRPTVATKEGKAGKNMSKLYCHLTARAL